MAVAAQHIPTSITTHSTDVAAWYRQARRGKTPERFASELRETDWPEPYRNPDRSWTVLSPSGETYRVKLSFGTEHSCNCPAGSQPKPRACWHIAWTLLFFFFGPRRVERYENSAGVRAYCDAMAATRQPQQVDCSPAAIERAVERAEHYERLTGHRVA